jgi:BirA family biotin operon repressor/biotin-[acetyl-CoA-carboxylase] ligase
MTYKLFNFEQIDSTNDEIKKLLLKDYSQDVLVVTDSQTRGRGRRGRRWYSPPGNLYMSFSKTPSVNPAVLAQISLVVGISVYRVMKKIMPESAQIALKWPNDILVNRMKLGGILVETEQFPNQSHATCIIGIGINILSAPEMVMFPACCLREFFTDLPDKTQLAQDIMAEFDRCYDIWINDSFEKLRNEWLLVSYGLGKAVSARAENGFEVYGRFLTLSLDGAVVICDDDGNEYLVRSSEVTYL